MDANPLSKLFRTKPELFVARKQPTIEFNYSEKPEIMNDLNNSVQLSPKIVDTMTTRVTLNLRNFERRSSDFGLPQIDNGESPRIIEVRHSICGNELTLGTRSPNVIQTTSGRKLEQFLNLPAGGLRNASCTCVPNMSQMSMNFSTRASRKVRPIY